LSVVIEKLQLDPLDLVRQKEKFGLKTLKIKIECPRNHSSHGSNPILIERPIVLKKVPPLLDESWRNENAQRH
jgi:hypothetical protein